MNLAHATTIAANELHALTVKEFRERLKISHSGFYKCLKAGRFRAIKVGRRTLIPASELTRILSDAPYNMK